MNAPVFAPGLRLSTLDVIVLLVGAVAAATMATVDGSWGFVIGFVLGHFFLFCNVVRLARPLELAWSGVFVALASATVATGVPGWLVTALVSLLATLAVVVVQMRKPSYHGVGWQWINPGLPAWWQAHRGGNRPAETVEA
jgi:hypothetical protein